MTVRVLGIPATLAHFAAAAIAAEVAERAAREVLSNDVEVLAKSRAPVDTGTLQDSITGDAEHVYTDVRYAPFVEYGTSDTSPQPFMRPAADTVDGNAAALAAKAVMDVV